jgi:hypothetical protein
VRRGTAFAARRALVAASLALACAMPARASSPPPSLEAVVTRHGMSLGESVTLQITARNANGVRDPEFAVPTGLELLSSGRMQNFTWMNGRSSTEIVFRYEIGANAAGTFTVGPFRASMGSTTLLAPAILLTVSAASTRLGAGPSGGSSSSPAALQVDVEPARPYVGQPILLRVRLIQRAQLAEDPTYVAPATPGFWAEPFTRPESYFAAEGTRRVLVTETRARLYPLAAGPATVGEAAAALALVVDGSNDPGSWSFGRVPRREVTVHSNPVTVNVRALPRGAPPGFDGAVGVFDVHWSLDRASTARDVPVNARLEVRGSGNLPLLHAPTPQSDAADYFAGTVDDSLGIAGSGAPGRRRFQWTLLAKREGRLAVAAPAFVWFDPVAGAYRTSDPSMATLDVGPALNTGDAGRDGFPPVFLEHPLPGPGAHGAEPWGFLVAGLAIGLAWALWRVASRPPADSAERAQQREWLRAAGLARGADFWRVAEEASAWLEAHNRPVKNLRREIASQRYGGSSADPEGVRRKLVEHLAQAVPAARSPLPKRGAAVVLALVAVALVVFAAPRGGEAEGRTPGDAVAARGDVTGACAAWRAAWRAGEHGAALAARLAWCEVRVGRVAPATVWVLAGERDEPRDPALGWVSERVREGGGLVGAGPARLPLRRIEWALLALVLGLSAGVAWPRRALAIALAVLAIGAGLARPLERAVATQRDVAVVRTPQPLPGAGLELEPGQVVRIVARDSSRVRVRAGGDVDGWLPARAVYGVEDLP